MAVSKDDALKCLRRMVADDVVIKLALYARHRKAKQLLHTLPHNIFARPIPAKAITAGVGLM